MRSSLVQKAIGMASKSRQDKINYIRRLGYSEKLADEILRKNGDRMTESELLRQVINAATKVSCIRGYWEGQV